MYIRDNNTYKYRYYHKKYFKITDCEYFTYQLQNRKVTFSTFFFENAWLKRLILKLRSQSIFKLTFIAF